MTFPRDLIPAESGTDIDWELVAKFVGATELECMECNMYDEGKQHWTYDHQTHTWDLPNRMRDFINNQYPQQLKPNFTAVSIHLWIFQEDCIDMYRRTHGPFKWTNELVTKVKEIRTRGCSNKEIAQYVSPLLTSRHISGKFSCLQRRNAGNTISDQHRKDIRALVDAFVGIIPCRDMPTTVKLAFPSIPAASFHCTIQGYIDSHKFYQDKFKGYENIDLVAQMAANGETATQMANKFDVPLRFIRSILARKPTNTFSKWWTQEETSKLMEYTSSSNGRIDWEMAQYAEKS
ncbi:hypothetical protein DL89DRAFT_260126 [Linderina pennispora]|uniref:Uncharacterized protein n=1 Tax=Linderina pennispora TaxID=61395 RepID=A0A1Y1VYY8_9FUNG|nr:uncharacterized protein DL89DRAFT_260126 [Linderina pennispora]ORX66481.1 hypothetical protein DL89DRAFT_260126 [Linderina pennispora]